MDANRGATRDVVSLSDVVDATGVPAAAICRYVDLDLLTVNDHRTGEDLFSRESVATIVVLRVMELANCGPHAMRMHPASRPHNPGIVDRALGEMVTHWDLSHPELPSLLRQLRAHSDAS